VIRCGLCRPLFIEMILRGYATNRREKAKKLGTKKGSSGYLVEVVEK
jgi:hypothetical protein